MKALHMLLIAALMALGSAAEAQETYCAPADQIAQALLNGHQERPAGLGVAAGGNLMVLYVSPEGSFTVVIEGPDGVACLAASGEGWEMLAEQEGPSL